MSTEIVGLVPGGLGFESGYPQVTVTIPFIRESQEFQCTGPQNTNLPLVNTKIPYKIMQNPEKYNINPNTFRNH